MKKTKIVCTIGPASSTKEILSKMIDAGMNVARLNFSHGTHEDHKEKIDLIKAVREEKNIPLPILLDTKGPEVRIKTFKNKSVELKAGDSFAFTTENIIGDETRVSVSYMGLCEDLKPGDRILLNNGLMVFRVTEVFDNYLNTQVEEGGILSDRKSMYFPDKLLNLTFLSEQDKRDLLFGIENDVDFIALSFVSNAQNVVDVKNFLRENGAEHIDVIAKIENRAGVENLHEIMEVSDGIMVARGDLGVEIPFEELPDVQKYIIKECRIFGKRVITATEMLESMIHNPRPTRAEISDVANAVYDGSSALMLSGETAAGKYPVAAVKSMAEICEFTEQGIDYKEWFRTTDYRIKNNLDAVSHATCSMAIDVKAKCIVVNSKSGRTARMVSRFRSPCDIIGMTTDERAWRKLNLSWGVIPAMSEEYSSIEVVFYQALKTAAKLLSLKTGDNVVLTGGQINGAPGNTNTIKVEIVK